MIAMHDAWEVTQRTIEHHALAWMVAAQAGCAGCRLNTVVGSKLHLLITT